MSTQLNVINDTLNLLRGKSVRFILEDCDLRMIRNLVNMIDEMDLVYDQEKMIYVDPHRETRGKARNIPRAQLARELEPGVERPVRNGIRPRGKSPTGKKSEGSGKVPRKQKEKARQTKKGGINGSGSSSKKG